MPFTASDQATLNRLQGEIDQAKRRIAQHAQAIARDNAQVARKTQEYHLARSRPGNQGPTLQSIQRAIDTLRRSIATYDQRIAKEQVIIARKVENANRILAKR